ncbi:hypothetical protein HCG51_20530 [Tolypothrix sp. PCC 7910]|uniref:hypothetical protein n=1 Tax=Tolypothrix sp. PCC 7910 TaxID=2099387 RepID=UPI00142797DA|nr:hypothetical protein [Tolypothrix sp. PCC 7910]QIR38855.1 hypothetical protein HCG51_20530 [Tolypothrix sp. PCC 7910]
MWKKAISLFHPQSHKGEYLRRAASTHLMYENIQAIAPEMKECDRLNFKTSQQLLYQVKFGVKPEQHSSCLHH